MCQLVLWWVEDLQMMGVEGQQDIITVENLTKKFHDFVAVDDISFSIKGGRSLLFWGRMAQGRRQ